MLNHLVTVVFLVGIAAIVTVNVAVFVQDVAFYRKAKWDLSLDSGNSLPFLSPMKESMLFHRIPVGVWRLGIGAFYLNLGGVFLYAVLYYIYHVTI